MGHRRALLLKARDYKKGFTSLPAVDKDVDLIGNALRDYGYQIAVADETTVSNATLVDRKIREFAKNCGRDDVHIIFFTGHGLVAENKDCIVPAGVSREEAQNSANQRVSTDLSSLVAEHEAGLVLFIIDACREEELAVKGAPNTFGSLKHLHTVERRFIRFFSCASGQVAYVLSSSFALF